MKQRYTLLIAVTVCLLSLLLCGTGLRISLSAPQRAPRYAPSPEQVWHQAWKRSTQRKHSMMEGPPLPEAIAMVNLHPQAPGLMVMRCRLPDWQLSLEPHLVEIDGVKSTQFLWVEFIDGWLYAQVPANSRVGLFQSWRDDLAGRQRIQWNPGSERAIVQCTSSQHEGRTLVRGRVEDMPGDADVRIRGCGAYGRCHAETSGNFECAIDAQGECELSTAWYEDGQMAVGTPVTVTPINGEILTVTLPLGDEFGPYDQESIDRLNRMSQSLTGLLDVVPKLRTLEQKVRPHLPPEQRPRAIDELTTPADLDALDDWRSEVNDELDVQELMADTDAPKPREP